jgi:phenylpropionate dioxygenase-like ring-hydroxylating dioxygenase large terminal subunit
MKLRELFVVDSRSRHASLEASAPGSEHSPPAYEHAKNRKQKARSAGLDPNYWYPVEYVDAVAPGTVREVRFWGASYALFRDENGEFHLLENRCAHRQLRLSIGNVEGCKLTCAYHGWQYDGEGNVVGIGHELFGHKMPRVQIGWRAVKVKYGLVWVFFGDPARATTRDVVTIPELEGPAPWPCVPLDFVWNAHHSIIIDNVSDFTHAYLHRKYAPFSDAKLIDCRTDGDQVFVSYEAKIGQGPIYSRVVDHAKTNTNKMDLCYEYPFQRSNTDNRIKHYCFVLPIDRTTTRTFFYFYYDPQTFKFPFLPMAMPVGLLRPLLRIGNALLVRPLLDQDGVAVEEEQRAYERHFDAPMMELNPAIGAFQTLTVRKWDEYLANAEQQKSRGAFDQVAATP